MVSPPAALAWLVLAAVAAPAPATAYALSTPQDPFAHPRASISFLNDLPIARQHADALLAAHRASSPAASAAEGEGNKAVGHAAAARADEDQDGSTTGVGWFFGDAPLPAAVAGLLDPASSSSSGASSPSSSSAASSSSSPPSSALSPLALANHTLELLLLPPSHTCATLASSPAKGGSRIACATGERSFSFARRAGIGRGRACPPSTTGTTSTCSA